MKHVKYLLTGFGIVVTMFAIILSPILIAMALGYSSDQGLAALIVCILILTFIIGAYELGKDFLQDKSNSKN